jgi:hypothetical protein
MSLHNPSLESQLHELFISQGQISSPSCIANLVDEFESFHGVCLSDPEIIKAIRSAGESFVDSMVTNEHDTEKEGYTDISPLADRVAYWEAMRPSSNRKKHIESILS